MVFLIVVTSVTLAQAGETPDQNILKDQDMLKRLNDIASFSAQEKEHILFALDAMITKVKLKSL